MNSEDEYNVIVAAASDNTGYTARFASPNPFRTSYSPKTLYAMPLEGERW